jgi:hypothetical protein
LVVMLLAAEDGWNLYKRYDEVQAPGTYIYLACVCPVQCS